MLKVSKKSKLKTEVLYHIDLYDCIKIYEKSSQIINVLILERPIY